MAVWTSLSCSFFIFRKIVGNLMVPMKIFDAKLWYLKPFQVCFSQFQSLQIQICSDWTCRQVRYGDLLPKIKPCYNSSKSKHLPCQSRMFSCLSCFEDSKKLCIVVHHKKSNFQFEVEKLLLSNNQRNTLLSVHFVIKSLFI